MPAKKPDPAPKPARRAAGEGGVHPYTLADGRVQWMVQFNARDADGQPTRVRKRGYPSRSAASVALQDALAAVRANTFVKPSRVTVAEYAEDWLAGLTVRPASRTSYARVLRLHVLPRVGRLPLQDLTSARLRRVWRELGATGRLTRQANPDGTNPGLTAASVRGIAAVVSIMLNCAVEDGLLKANPMKASRPPKAKEAAPKRATVWTPEQARTFLAWCAEHRPEWRVLYRVAYMTGMRRGEIIGLRWGDIDAAAGTVTVQRQISTLHVPGVGLTRNEGPTKNGKARTVDLDAETLAALRAHRAEWASYSLAMVRSDAPVFPTVEGAPRDPRAVSQAFDRHQALAREVHDLPRLRFHDLRHSSATAMLQAGAPVHVVAQRIGDTAAILLSTYSHVLAGQQRTAADQVAALLSGT